MLQQSFVNRAPTIRPLFTMRIVVGSCVADLKLPVKCNDHGRLHVPPFTSNILLLILCFTLLHVTMNSTAQNFTITMASSEDPRLITSTLLLRLGLKESQLLRPESDGPSLGKIVYFLNPPTFNTTTRLR